MHKPTEQDTVDAKINRFLNKKAPWKTASKMLAGYMTLPGRTVSHDSDISYELLEWHHTEMVHRTTWQKAH